LTLDGAGALPPCEFRRGAAEPLSELRREGAGADRTVMREEPEEG
jgi:hypothetical protein